VSSGYYRSGTTARKKVAPKRTTSADSASNILGVAMLDWFSRRKAAKPSTEKPADVTVDGFLETYARWRAACEEVRSAYELWRRCTPSHRAVGFKTYLAALEREELAADAHCRRAMELRAAAR
jgi:hypothetical protein